MRSGEETAKADPSGSQGSQAPNQNDTRDGVHRVATRSLRQQSIFDDLQFGKKIKKVALLQGKSSDVI